VYAFFATPAKLVDAISDGPASMEVIERAPGGSRATAAGATAGGRGTMGTGREDRDTTVVDVGRSSLSATTRWRASCCAIVLRRTNA